MSQHRRGECNKKGNSRWMSGREAGFAHRPIAGVSIAGHKAAGVAGFFKLEQPASVVQRVHAARPDNQNLVGFHCDGGWGGKTWIQRNELS